MGILRLDNEAAAITRGEISFETVGASEWVLKDIDQLADSDLVNEIAAWKSKHLAGRRSGEVVQVKWKRGHPERHKGKRPSGWDVHDKGIFLADLIVDEFHTIGGSMELYDVLSRQRVWCLWWRGVQPIGQLRIKAVEAIHIDLLSRYMPTISGSGQHCDWICVPSASALVRKGGERL